MENSLQIVCFNVPYPPNYGGAIDVFFKIKALHELGARIRLHCFTYGQYQPRKELEKYCNSIYYYERSGDILKHFSTLPFIVVSRKSRKLLDNLAADPAPILFEGLHTTAYIDDEALRNHVKFVRMHNMESAYYKKLSKWEQNLLIRAYLQTESSRLANYEERIYYSDATILTISKFDQMYFSTQHRGHTVLVPPFHPFSKVETLPGKGDYIFIHADFSIADNKAWVEKLLVDTSGELGMPFRLAGKNADQLNLKKCPEVQNIQIESNVSQSRMFELIQNAHATVVQAFNSEGFKLKLLYSLFIGRHCIANEMIMKGTDLGHLCHMANSPAEVVQKVKELKNVGITADDIFARGKTMDERFSNLKNAQIILDLASGQTESEHEHEHK